MIGKITKFWLSSLLVMMIISSASFTLAETPQYGGELRVFPPMSWGPLGWDPAAWNWKVNHDVSLVYEPLLSGDLSKGPGGTNEYGFGPYAYIPDEVEKGELAESYEIKQNPLRIEFKIRKGVYWQEKKGVMKSRELTANDVLDFFQRSKNNKKAILSYYDFIDRFAAEGRYKFVVYLKHYNANWKFRLTWGFYFAINPPEVAKAGASNWKNVAGTGPYMLADYRAGSYQLYTRNPNYWNKTTIDGKRYQLPFTDSIRYLLVGDEQARMAALRTGKVDLAGVSLTHFNDIIKQEPRLKYRKFLVDTPQLMAMRMDKKPFNDIRVRKAIALAIDQRQIMQSIWKGNAELFAYPMPPTWKNYYVPLGQQSTVVKEQFTYNPEKAKQLLAEAGYPNGFSVEAMFFAGAGTGFGVDEVQMVAAYLAKVGVKLELKPMQWGPFQAAMFKRTHSPIYFYYNGHTNPIIMLRKNFTPFPWNATMFSIPEFDKRMDRMMRNPNKPERIKEIKALTTFALEQVPFVQLPCPYGWVMWWPWVKNYHGELNVGAQRIGPPQARIWIDQKLKKQMGF